MADTEAPPLGVVCDARRLVRDGGRNGVVGREGTRVRDVLLLRSWRPEEGGLVAGVVDAAVAIVAASTLSRGLAATMFVDRVVRSRDVAW